MKKIIIFGLGRFAYQMFRYLSMGKESKVAAFTVETEYMNSNWFCDYPVVPFERLEKEYPAEHYKILVCIGYNRMNDTRKRVFSLVKDKGYEIADYIHPSSVILASKLGEGNIILENSTVGIGSTIGDGNIIYNNAVISHDGHIGNFNFFAPSSTVLGNVIIGNCCFFGGNSTVKGLTVIADSTLVGANSFIKTNTQENDVYVPAHTVRLQKNSFDFFAGEEKSQQ